MATQQETFDIGATHLMTQAKRCIDDKNGQCRYRLNDLMCVAGVFIPDEKYDPKMEGRSVITVAGNISFAGQVILEEGHDLNLLRDMQECHDDADMHNWPNVLREIAQRFGLSSQVIDDLELDFTKKIF